MKIKIFGLDGYRANIEEQVNEFIKDKKVIDIKQSECVEGQQQCYSFTLTVMYED